MHSVLLLTALTATSGLFGGGRQCTTGTCGRPAVYYTYAPRYYTVPAPCATCPAPATAAAPAAQRVAVPQAPAPVQRVAVPQAPPARAGYYYSAGYYYPTAATCPTGNCPYR